MMQATIWMRWLLALSAAATVYFATVWEPNTQVHKIVIQSELEGWPD